MSRLWTALVVAVTISATGIVGLEGSHYKKYEDLFGYGLHTDVVLGSSDVASNDTYVARLWNFSFIPFDIEGCFTPSDVGGAPPSVLFRWDIQRWNPSKREWDSLRGADNWVSEPLGGYWKQESCRPVKTRLNPFKSLTVAWVYKGWVTTAEPIRMAIHTSTTAPPQSQRIIYTKTFVVRDRVPGTQRR